MAHRKQRFVNQLYEDWFSPLDLPGLTLWLRSDLGITLATGVSAWADQSGNGYNVSQATGSARPTYAASGGPNGRPYLSFNSASSQYLLGSYPGSVLANNCTVVAVSKAADTAGTYKAIYCLGDASNGITLLNGTTSAQRAVNCNAVATDADGSNTTNWESWIVTSSAAPLQTLSVGGASMALSPNNSVINAANTYHAVGSAGNLTAVFPFNGMIAEVILYSGVLNATQVAQLRRYTTSLYGAI